MALTKLQNSPLAILLFSTTSVVPGPYLMSIVLNGNAVKRIKKRKDEMLIPDN